MIVAQPNETFEFPKTEGELFSRTNFEQSSEGTYASPDECSRQRLKTLSTPTDQCRDRREY